MKNNMNSNIRFINTNDAFENCFNCDEEREKYMYMHSIEDKHYFKNIDTRKYTIVDVKGLSDSKV